MPWLAVALGLALLLCCCCLCYCVHRRRQQRRWLQEKGTPRSSKRLVEVTPSLQLTDRIAFSLPSPQGRRQHESEERQPLSPSLVYDGTRAHLGHAGGRGARTWHEQQGDGSTDARATTQRPRRPSNLAMYASCAQPHVIQHAAVVPPLPPAATRPGYLLSTKI